MTHIPASLLLVAAALGPETALPPPLGLEMAVGDALEKRHSVRRFAPERNVSRDQLATLLWAAVGITRPDETHPRGGKRTSPSAYGAAAVDAIVTSEKGTFLYSPKRHALIGLSEEDLRGKLAGADWAAEAPVILVLIASLERYPEQVSPQERRLYSYADAAAAGENIYLAATALGLGTVLTVSPSGAGEVLKLGEDQTAVFVFPVGHERRE